MEAKTGLGNMETAAVIQFQKKQEAKFSCSKCGEDRFCDCNAPAIEKLAEIREQARQRDRAYKERKREQKQQSGDVADDETDIPLSEIPPSYLGNEKGDLNPNFIGTDCDTPQDFWRRSVSVMAGDAIAMRASWSRNYGDYTKFKASTELVTLAEQAADAWRELAEQLRGLL